MEMIKKKFPCFLQAKHSADDDDDVNWNTDDEIDNFQSSPVNYIIQSLNSTLFLNSKEKNSLTRIFLCMTLEKHTSYG